MIEAGDLPPCTACGACCFSTLPEYIRVFGTDWDRMDERAQGFAAFVDNRCYMRLEEGHCAALVVDVGEGGSSFKCGIYEMRPDCCRGLERGSGACRGELSVKADRPAIAVEALLARRRALAIVT